MPDRAEISDCKKDRVKISELKQLIVEGNDDKRFYEKMIRLLDLPGIQVQIMTGKAELKDVLKALKSAPGYSSVISVGIIRDADDDPKIAFTSVQTALTNAGLTAPANPGEIRKIAKARAHAFLASREAPGKRVGEAAEAGYWDLDHPIFDEIKTFLRNL